MENGWTKRIEALEAEIKRLARDNKVCVELNDKLVAEIARLEDRVSAEYEAERADDRARIKGLEAERDADRKREYGYSQQTVDALTLERDKLRAERNDWKARYQSVAEMHDALIAEFNEMRAENKRLRELVDGATEVVEISNFTFPAQREWKAAWLKKAAKVLREASDE